MIYLNLSYVEDHASLSMLGPRAIRCCCILSWVSKEDEGYVCEQGRVFIELNHFISVGKRQLSKSRIDVAG